MHKPLVVQDLGHEYDGTKVYANVTLDISPGELVAVLGTSGCGKTPLLRAIAGLVTPSSGKIEINGRIVAENDRILVPIEQRKIGLVFQDYALFPYMSVRENIGFGLDSKDSSRVNKLMELTGITELGNRRPEALSGGQQQRVALARALAPEPHLLLLDEPFANVDASRRLQLGQNLVETLRQENRSGLFVTHDQADAMSHASRIAVFTTENGVSSIRQCAQAQEIFRKPVSHAVAELLGPVSFIEANAKGKRAESSLGTHELSTEAEGEVDLVCRTDDLTFMSDPAGTAVVRTISYLGTHHRVSCHSSSGDIYFDAKDSAPKVGERGTISLRGPVWAISRAK